jgi:hypothetical protein
MRRRRMSDIPSGPIGWPSPREAIFSLLKTTEFAESMTNHNFTSVRREAMRKNMSGLGAGLYR